MPGSIEDRVRIDSLAHHAGQVVTIAGWLHRWRRQSRIAFMVVRDASGMAQVVVDDRMLADQIDRFHHESVVQVMGRVVTADQAPGGIELHDPRVEVISPALEPPPFDLFRPQIGALLPTILDHAAVALRHPRQRAIWRIADASMSGFRSALRERDFVEIQTPKIVGAATESGSSVFRIDYFGRPAYLAQSPQLYKQIMAGVFERVYEVGPVFRAEPHDTPRHVNEYVSLDVELAFIEDHTSVMALLRDVLAGMINSVNSAGLAVQPHLSWSLPDVPNSIPNIHFQDAQALITSHTGEQITHEPDLSPAHERWLSDWALREYGSEFLFVIGYPMVKRPFYTHPDPERPEFSRSFDLLFRGQELVTGGQRLHRYGDYLAALDARGLDRAPLDGYLEAFRHGMPPHGGFAIGLERWVARLTGIANIRETALFPRDMMRLTP